MLVEQTRDGTQRTWWLPRAVVRLLDAAEHAERQWVHAARTRRASTAVTEPPTPPRRPRDAGGRQTTGPEGPTASLLRYDKELEGQLYSVLSRKPGTSRRVAGWACAVCRTAPATVLDHCHEHGYVRAPVCQSCNTQERPDHLYDNDIRVANRYTRLFHTDTDDWLRHWHRCPGCRARTTLPLPHLAAWTAHILCRSLRPTHRAPAGASPAVSCACPGRAVRTRPVPACSLSPSTSAPPASTASWRESPTAKPSSGFAPGWPRRPPPWPQRPVLTAWTASLPGSGQSSRTPAARTWNSSERAPGDFTRALARTAATYSELREELFSDIHHTRPEPPWRIVRQRTMAIRAQSAVLLGQPTFVLRRLDAGSDIPGAATWDFTVIANPSDSADEDTTFVVMVSTGDHTGAVPVQVSEELENERAWYQQLEYGFHALGITPFLTAIHDPDRHRKRATDDGYGG